MIQGLRKRWGLQHPAFFALVLILTSVLLLCVALICLGYTGPDDEEFWVDETVGHHLMVLCPEVAWSKEHFEAAEERALENCLPALPIAEDPCVTGPSAGVVQIRSWDDQVEGYEAPVTSTVNGKNFVDRGAHATDGSGVIYLLEEQNAKDCTYGHIIVHALGGRGPSPTGHVRAPTSIFAEECGTAWHHLNQCEN